MKLQETLVALLCMVMTVFFAYCLFFEVEPDKDLEVLTYSVEGFIVLCMAFLTVVGWTVALPDAKEKY